ncbi:DUF488 domain-containing protein [soil metagenome]
MAIHFTKTVYEPPESEDGCRLIIMRRYPRGIAKSRAHAWIPQLAPTLPLVHWYHDNKGAIEAQWQSRDPVRFVREIAKFWKTYSRRYLSEMRGQRSLIEFLASLQRDFGVTFTLLCACPDHRICHRSLLARLINEVPPGNR